MIKLCYIFSCVPGAFRKKSQVFQISQETREHNNSTNHRKMSEHNWCALFCTYEQVVLISFLIVYNLFNLLPQYLQQLPFYYSSIGGDTNFVATIAIACLFLRVGHCRLHYLCLCHRYRIQYTGAGPLPLLDGTWRDTETEPLFGADRCRSARGGTPL